MSKTNVIRILESNGIQHSIHTYEVDENDLSGTTVAGKIGADENAVYKTLVAKGDKNGINIFCVSVAEELNLKKAASVSDNKKIELVKVKDLFLLTGYIRGGCSPIGMKKHFPTFIEESSQLFEKIYVSAGIRGMQVCLSPIDLVKIAEGTFTDLL
jgi:Cys-tRNA(Pro)/Cys-tRNA(Cys) deacylase